MTLDLSPQSARDARRWAADACHHLGRPELVPAAELAVSELVTNALLHAAPPIRLSLHGTVEHPRFEVSDGSAAPPVPHPRPAADDLDTADDDSHLSTIGRGLALVATSSVAWGAYIHDEGKTVWFEPAPELNEDPAFLGEIHEAGAWSAMDPAPPDAVTVRLPRFPTERYAAWLRHFRDLQRELRLLALAHETTYPMARELSDFLSGFADRLRRAGGLTDPAPRIDADGDLVSHLDPDLADMLEQMVGVLELADAFCRDERMLTPPNTPENRAFQEWAFGQVIGQLRGADPVPWSAVAHSAR